LQKAERRKIKGNASIAPQHSAIDVLLRVGAGLSCPRRTVPPNDAGDAFNACG
jgi:hypothetical protein